ncbi:Ig-like domain-containing protein [Lacticaseibacillus hulanensis]|uniref:Ig-like domain-containing protein n=1 Tax=Lacticaseibacillus hulanensis TaxID=2493111 RepID=UPI0013E3510C|nr:Ig-like domain-containing protein [Lacticaseibacillus hulanensis]
MRSKQHATSTVRYKMYKDGKRWVIAGLFSVVTAAFMVATPHSTQAATDADAADKSAVTQTVETPSFGFDAVTDQADAATEPENQDTKAPATEASEDSAKTAADKAAKQTTPAAQTDGQAKAATQKVVLAPAREAVKPAEPAKKEAVTITAKYSQNALGMTTISGQATPGATITAVADSGHVLGNITASADGGYSINTRVAGAVTLTATKNGDSAYATLDLPSATAEQKAAAKSAANDLADDRTSIISVDVAEKSETKLDTDDINVDTITPSDVGLGEKFTNLNDEAASLGTNGVGESTRKPVEFKTSDQTQDVDVVTTNSSLGSASIFGTNGQYDVIQLGDGLQAQIRKIGGKNYAVVTAEFTKSLGDIVPFYNVFQGLVSLIPIVGGLGDSAMQALEDISTVTALAPVYAVEDSKTADGDYTKFYVDLSGINLTELVADKVDATLSANTSQTLSESQQATLMDSVAKNFEGGFSASFLGKTTVVTPLSVRPTAEITADTDQKDIAIASAFYSDNTFDFKFGNDQDTYAHPLYVQMADSDGDGVTDIKEAEGGGETTPTTDPGDDPGDHGGDTTVPVSTDLNATATVDKSTGTVTIKGSGASAEGVVDLIAGSGYTSKDGLTPITMVTAEDDGTFSFTIGKDDADKNDLYGGKVTVLDNDTSEMIEVPVAGLDLTGKLTGTISIDWANQAPRPDVADHTGDALWAEIEDYYANGNNPKLEVTINSDDTKKMTIELTDPSMFTWAKGAITGASGTHNDEFVLTKAGTDYVTKTVQKQLPDYNFKASDITAGGSLTINQAAVTVSVSGSATVSANQTDFKAAALKASSGQITAQAMAGSDKIGSAVKLDAGTDYQLAPEVKAELGNYSNAFVLTAAGLNKVQGTLDANHKLDSAVKAANVKGGSLSVGDVITVTYTVKYAGAGTDTPKDVTQTATWSGEKGANGQEVWSTNDKISAIKTPDVPGFTADKSVAFAGIDTSGKTKPTTDSYTETVTYTAGVLSIGKLVPDGKYVPVFGQAGPNVEVEIKTQNGEPITTTTDDDGNYEAVVKLDDAPARSTVTATVTIGGNKDTVSGTVEANTPKAPKATITPIINQVSTITGTAEPGAAVTVKTEGGDEVGTVAADGVGNFTVSVPVTVAPPHTKLLVTQTTAGGTSLPMPVETHREALKAPTVTATVGAPDFNFNSGN